MLEYILLLIIAGVVALAAEIYYMLKAGYDIHDIHKGAY